MKLTKQSKDLIHFFIKHNHISRSQMNSLTHKTREIVTALYRDLLEAHNYAKTETTRMSHTIKKIQNSSQITKPKFFHFKSFPESIRTHIDDTMKTEICYTFSLYDRKVKVYFVLEEDIADIKKYNTYIQPIVMWLYMLHLYAPKKCAKSIIIYFYMTSLVKTLPQPTQETLNEIHVNTAFTTTCPVDSEIVVFRKEEWFKVFIHETFHNFALDFSAMNCKQVNECILDIFKVNSKVNSYEAYTEFWAEIINALFCSLYSLNDIHDLPKFLSYFETYIELERSYSYFQMVKALDYMGLKYKDMYSTTMRASLMREKYRENTNVLSYYVVKTILLNNYQGFLSWCDRHNTNILEFKKTADNMGAFCHFIGRNYKTQTMLEGVGIAQQFLSTMTVGKLGKERNIPFVRSNLRMTICELG